MTFGLGPPALSLFGAGVAPTGPSVPVELPGKTAVPSEAMVAAAASPIGRPRTSSATAMRLPVLEFHIPDLPSAALVCSFAPAAWLRGGVRPGCHRRRGGRKGSRMRLL